MKKMNANKKGGFTLIELLVVIAIIGILSSIVLVSLNSARKKGSDTRVISDVNEVRTQLESDYSGGNYSTDLTSAGNTNANANTNANIKALGADAVGQGSNVMITASGTPSVTAYAVYGAMLSNPAISFCIDNTGKAESTSSTISTTSGICP